MKKSLVIVIAAISFFSGTLSLAKASLVTLLTSDNEFAPGIANQGYVTPNATELGPVLVTPNIDSFLIFNLGNSPSNLLNDNINSATLEFTNVLHLPNSELRFFNDT